MLLRDCGCMLEVEEERSERTPLAEVGFCFPKESLEIFFTFRIDTKFLDFKKNVSHFASNDANSR